jgi:hypothetical protein
MESQVLSPQVRKPTAPPEPAAPTVRTVLVHLAQEQPVVRLRPLAPHLTRQESLPEAAAPTPVETWESLVADPRGSRTPAQRVDERLLALLPPGRPESCHHAAGGAQGRRRTPEGVSPATRRPH